MDLRQLERDLASVERGEKHFVLGESGLRIPLTRQRASQGEAGFGIVPGTEVAPIQTDRLVVASELRKRGRMARRGGVGGLHAQPLVVGGGRFVSTEGQLEIGNGEGSLPVVGIQVAQIHVGGERSLDLAGRPKLAGQPTPLGDVERTDLGELPEVSDRVRRPACVGCRPCSGRDDLDGGGGSVGQRSQTVVRLRRPAEAQQALGQHEGLARLQAGRRSELLETPEEIDGELVLPAPVPQPREMCDLVGPGRVRFRSRAEQRARSLLETARGLQQREGLAARRRVGGVPRDPILPEGEGQLGIFGRCVGQPPPLPLLTEASEPSRLRLELRPEGRRTWITTLLQSADERTGLVEVARPKRRACE